ncbi:MAG: hypothetical protein BMS9Abin36_1558 [Gammaproteobacteria bacterium]|nr:MAG: hypothetical protein BMS9Abin36_1558 [Gammaproteobacteria bacterium]
MRKHIIAALVMTALAGCATSEKYSKLLDTWKGDPVERLVGSNWGYPDTIIKAPNGNDVYIYKWESISTNKKGYTNRYWCNTFFEIDDSKTIVRWRWKGNHCVSKYQEK